jgi:GTPase Era involved in 16S rRNA processing
VGPEFSLILLYTDSQLFKQKLQVYLNLSVRVNKEWRKNEKVLKAFGYMA